jgi:tRNA-specific 2-thiouridylase
MTKRVLIAMSGGVDSSVTAALLKQQGFATAGVTMKLTAGRCCDIGAAQAVCSHLGIEHHIIDAQEKFSRSVVDSFISEYKRGRTPNPCIQCNDQIKFRSLLEYARGSGFDFLATGHYARIEHDRTADQFVLKKGVDETKDQSYFLYRLTQEQMRSVLLPLGAMRKTAVRELARSLDLPTAERPESQEICFVADDDYRSFLRDNAPETITPGEMVLTDGSIVGKHEGIAFYTIGQRRHLGVAAGERLYVVRIEPQTNRVVLGSREELLVNKMLVTHITGLSAHSAYSHVQVKIRYRSALAACSIRFTVPDAAQIEFEHPVAGVCPGQAAVFYQEDTVIGGGVISE